MRNPTIQSGVRAHCAECNAEAVVLPGHLGRERARCECAPRGKWVQGPRVTVDAYCTHCAENALGVDVGMIGQPHIRVINQSKGPVEVLCPGIWTRGRTLA